MTNNIIGTEVYKNKHYTVRIDKSVHSDRDILCYQIINNTYGIVERESSNLVSSLIDANGMSEALDNIEKNNSIIDIPEDAVITLQ